MKLKVAVAAFSAAMLLCGNPAWAEDDAEPEGDAPSAAPSDAPADAPADTPSDSQDEVQPQAQPEAQDEAQPEAQDEAPKEGSPGRHAHDGFYLRWALGLGYASSMETFPNGNGAFSGLGSMGNFGLGWAVSRNLILHLDLASAMILSPKKTTVFFGVSDSTTASSPETVFNLGVGLTYYVMPSNLYLGIAAGASVLGAADGFFRPGTGWGVTARVGKEWWVSDNWGLGLAAQFLFSSVPDVGTDGTYTVITPATGLMFSATYN